MSPTLMRAPGGYEIRLEDGTLIGSLSREEAIARLSALHVDGRDIDGMIRTADRFFATGMNDEVREFRAIQERARKSEAAALDLDLVRSELESDASRLDKPFLVGILELAGRSADSEQSLLRTLEQSRDENTVIAALQALARWSSPAYAFVAKQFISGTPWDQNGWVRKWAMAQAGWLLREGKAPALLQDLIKVATDPGESDTAKFAARLAIASAAGDGVPQAVIDRGDEVEFERVIRRALERLMTEGRSPEEGDVSNAADDAS